MANKKNKVKYNLKNVHYALLNTDTTGNVTYGTPIPIPGDVRKIRPVFYKCAASRPGGESQINEDEIKVNTETLQILIYSLLRCSRTLPI